MSQPVSKINLSKLQAAQRQIDTAIRMLFGNEDPVPIHTIVMAAFRILRDLAAHREDVYMEGQINRMLIPERRNEFWAKIHGFSNFLKHADRDPDDMHDGVGESVNEPIIFMSILYYIDLGNLHTPEMLAFRSWFSALHPEFVLETADPEFRQVLDSAGSGLRSMSHEEQRDFGLFIISLAKDSIETNERDT